MTRHEPDGGVCAVCCADWPCPDSAQTWVLRLPWSKPPISANDRHHWRKKAAIVANVRGTVQGLVNWSQYRDDPLPVHADRITVGLDYYPRDSRRRDADNLVVPFLKACIDGLVDAHLVVDDDDRHVVRTMPVIHAPDGDPRLELTIRLGAA